MDEHRYCLLHLDAFGLVTKTPSGFEPRAFSFKVKSSTCTTERKSHVPLAELVGMWLTFDTLFSPFGNSRPRDHNDN
jgi:hypothetical protein